MARAKKASRGAEARPSDIANAIAESPADVDALLARVDAVLADNLYWFGIRHHSPTLARMLDHCIRERKPKIVFIEGPAEAQAMIEFIVDKGTRPPVAIYSSFRDDAAAEALRRIRPDAAAPRWSVWYPLVTYSPEYIAMRAARDVGAQAIFIDLPHYALSAISPFDDANPPQSAPVHLEAHAQRSEFYQSLTKAAGRRTWAETWDTLFETRRPAESHESVRRDMALFCAAVRATTPEGLCRIDGTLPRERYMWRTIQESLRTQGVASDDAMVVCGGFHLFLDKTDPEPPPLIPEGTVSVTLAPYSYFRISELSGYGAGNRAPRFYELLHERHAAGAEHSQVVIDHIIDVIKEARRRGEPLSSADAIGAVQHALLLAKLRGRPDAVLDDIHDALISCCCKGNPETEASRLLEAIDEMDIGTKLGRVSDRVGRLPIVADFYDQLSRLDMEELAAREKARTYALDKRQPLDAARSAFLHRLIFLEVEIGGVKREQGTFGQSVFKEEWKVKWDAKIEPALIEKNLHGDTIELAATTLLRERLGKSATEAGVAARELVRAIDMDLSELVSQAEQSCGYAIDYDDRFGSLTNALCAFLVLERYASFRGLSRNRLGELIIRCFDRACFAIGEVASVPAEQWDEVVEGLLALAEPVLQRDDLDSDLFASHVERAAAISTMPFLRGAFLGTLTELRRRPADSLASELSAYAKGSVEQQVGAGDFLHGVLRVSRTAIQLGAAALVSAVDELLRLATRETFLGMVPRLRAAFETLHERQRDGVATRVAELYGLEESESLRTLSTSVQALQLLAELDAEVAEIMADWLEVEGKGHS